MIPPSPAADLHERKVTSTTGWICGVVAALLVVIFIGQGVRIARLPVDKMVAWNVVIDDGYYYLQVARNLARGHGSTFDRVNKTNGYQPLWTFALVPLFWFVDSPELGLKAAVVLAAALGGAAILLLYLCLRRLVGYGAALLVCAMMVANPYYLKILQGGLETPILFLCLAGLAAYWSWRGDAILSGQRRACVTLGLLFSAVLLCRVDTALILLPLGGCMVLWGRASLARRGARLLWIALPAGIVMLPYVAWNWLSHGSLVPVSGQVKSWVASTYQPTWDLFKVTEQWRGITRTFGELAWPHVMGEPRMDRILPILGLCAIPLLLVAARLLWSRGARENRLASVLVCGGTAGVVIHGLFMFLVYRSCGHWNYHYFFPFSILITTLTLGVVPLLLGDVARLLLRVLGRRGLRLALIPLGAALSILAVAWVVHKGLPAAEQRHAKLSRPPQESFRLCRLQAAEFIRKNYAAETVFGAWWAGTLGYFSDRRVVKLDGVINSGEFFRRYLKTDTVTDYIRKKPITHLVDFFWRNPIHPRARPAMRAFWWEHDKEHIIHRLRRRILFVHRIAFRGDSGMYVLAVQ